MNASPEIIWSVIMMGILVGWLTGKVMKDSGYGVLPAAVSIPRIIRERTAGAERIVTFQPREARCGKAVSLVAGSDHLWRKTSVKKSRVGMGLHDGQMTALFVSSLKT